MKIHRSHRFSRTILLCFLVMVFSNSQKSYSQVPSKAQTIQYLNKLGGDTIHFYLKSTFLTIQSLTRNATLLREDKVNLTDLDTLTKYEAESRLVVLNCLTEYKDCVTRSLIVQKVRRNYNRLSIASDPILQAAYSIALVHLLKIVTLENYQDEIQLPVL